MNCIFCQSELRHSWDNPDSNELICDHCPVMVWHIVGGPLSKKFKGKLIAYFFRVPDPEYDLMVIPIQKKELLKIYSRVRDPNHHGMPSEAPLIYKKVLALDYIPEGINPNNATDWVNKLLNLKVFS